MNIFPKSWHHLAVLAGIGLGLLTQPAWAQLTRNFPADSYQVWLDAVSDPIIEVGGTNVQMSGAVIIFGTNNGTETRSALSAGSMIRIEFDSACQVKKIWILNDSEIIHVPLWLRLLHGSFQPPCASAS